MLEVLTRTVSTEAARPLLIRRPGRISSGGERVWAVAYANGAVVWGSWGDDHELLAAAEALAAASPDPPSAVDPLILVCTHGLHDACCAIRGRPVAEALASRWPGWTWECSHVGGDRFAANVVLLPDGVYYGNLDPASAVETVQSHLDGKLSVVHLRGLTSMPPPAQVAAAAVHERLGPLGPRDVHVTGVERTAAGSWAVELSAPLRGLPVIRAVVAAVRRPPAQLTCRALAVTPATEYRVVDLSLTP